jgi:hypothetical protein
MVAEQRSRLHVVRPIKLGFILEADESGLVERDFINFGNTYTVPKHLYCPKKKYSSYSFSTGLSKLRNLRDGYSLNFI